MVRATEFCVAASLPTTDRPAKQCEAEAEAAGPRNRPLRRNPPSAAEAEVNPDWNSAPFELEAETPDWSMLPERLGRPVEEATWADQEPEVSWSSEAAEEPPTVWFDVVAAVVADSNSSIPGQRLRSGASPDPG